MSLPPLVPVLYNVQLSWTAYNTQVAQARLPGQRAGLTREAVLAAAHRLLADEGIDAVTMRAVADSLGVSPNTLYSHVTSKTDLVDALLDDVLAAVDVPPADEDATAGLHAIMASTYEVLLAHPDLVPPYVARQGARGENAQHLGEVMLALLGRAGVTGPRAVEARRVLIVYTIGFAAFATSPLFGDQGGGRLPAKDMHINFDTGLRWLLAGITTSGGRRRR